MEMEDEEMAAGLVFEAREVDFDYDFDAAMYFDFTSEESLAEAREAERWFDTAQSYLPSPFVTKLVFREENKETLISEDCRGSLSGTETPVVEVDNEECGRTYGGIFTNLQKVSTRPLDIAAEPICYNHTCPGKPKAKVKSTLKPNFYKSSTLMKPTASVLAKQNRHPQIDGSRFLMQFDLKEKSICIESQAAKKQKLEWGHSRKVDDAKQQNDFVHKAPKKYGAVDRSSAQLRLRLTIPREPDLETAMRPKISTEIGHVTVVAQRFKARPLNRKILEAPSLPLPKNSSPNLPEFQEFYLKTSEMATQHTPIFSSSSLQHTRQVLDKSSRISAAAIRKGESRRPSIIDAQQQDRCSAHVFKARPLNKKIFTSKGDIGVFRNSKRETTVPKEFNFHTEKRIHHNPPIDLFSKLSLTSELVQNNGYRLQLPPPRFISKKMTHPAKEKSPISGGRQTPTSEVGNQLSVRRLSIR